MAYDIQMAEQISTVLSHFGADFYEKKMFAGVCFMVDDKMCCGTHIDKISGENTLLCRLSQEVAEHLLEHDSNCRPMDFTGRPMKGYVFVNDLGTGSEKELRKYLQLCLDYNPIAKKSVKKK